MEAKLGDQREGRATRGSRQDGAVVQSLGANLRGAESSVSLAAAWSWGRF